MCVCVRVCARVGLVVSGCTAAGYWPAVHSMYAGTYPQVYALSFLCTRVSVVGPLSTSCRP